VSRIFAARKLIFFSPLAAEFRFGKIFSRKAGTVPAEFFNPKEKLIEKIIS
jgi:hypothetical protein